MPYIKQNRRHLLGDLVGENNLPMDISAGDINYLVTMLCQYYIQNKGASYQAYNDLLGALEGCKLELYRRQIANYEDSKKNENGDV